MKNHKNHHHIKVHHLSPVQRVIVAGTMTLFACLYDIACELGAFSNGRDNPLPLHNDRVAIEQEYCREGEVCPL